MQRNETRGPDARRRPPSAVRDAGSRRVAPAEPARPRVTGRFSMRRQFDDPRVFGLKAALALDELELDAFAVPQRAKAANVQTHRGDHDDV